MEYEDQEGIMILSAADSDFAEQLSTLKHLDFARILFRLSEPAKDELRSCFGSLIIESQLGE
jgi:hypothetical protein